MGAKTNIEWCHRTFNPFIGCTKVSPGCDHCYAEAMMDKRLHKVKWGGTPIRTSESNWQQPLKWDADARKRGVRERVFCASLADVFDNNAPAQWRVDLLKLMGSTENLDWLLLTKRIGNARQMLNEAISEIACGINNWDDLPWPNVWLGATVVNQEEADRDIPKLLATPAAKRFLSIEPMLGPIDLTRIPISGGGHHEFDPIIAANVLNRIESYPPLPRVDWVIVGGESGNNARPLHPDWPRSLRDQCSAAGVPFFFKQHGEFIETPDGADAAFVFETDFASRCSGRVTRVGKKAAGRLLDDREWNEVPA